MKVLFLLFVVMTHDFVHSQNYYLEPYTVTTSQYQCETRYSKSCKWWGFRCRTESYNYCWTTYIQSIRQRIVCKPGWSYPCGYCNIPICDPSCPRGKTCFRPNSCQCYATDLLNGCANVPCSANLNCYPGTCISGFCQCDTSFTGPNCEKTLKAPVINDCKVKVTNKGNYVQSFDCSHDGTPSQIFWVKPSIFEITISYKVFYEQGSFNFPTADFVKEIKFGIVSSKAVLQWNNQGTGLKKDCEGIGIKNPVFYKDCNSIISYSESGGLQDQKDNTNINITIVAGLGGSKTGSNNIDIRFSQFQEQNYEAEVYANRSVTLSFDKTAPTHCLSDKNANCPLFPIIIDNDITTNSRLKATIANWTDSESGIANYTVAIYFLQLNSQNRFSDPAKPEKEFNVQPPNNEFLFDVNTPGVYSIVVTVKDLAGNEGKARNIFTYSSNANIKINPDAPVRCTNCEPESDYKSILKSGINILKFDWTGHFKRVDNFNENLGREVEPWNEVNGIDDLPSTNYFYGSRTINKVQENATLNFEYGFLLNPFPNQTIPDNLTKIADTSVELNVGNIQSGDVVRFYVSAHSLGGFTIEESQNIIYDDTPIKSGTTAKFVANTPDESTSRVNFELYDLESGLKSVNYTLRDTTIKSNLLTNQIVPISTRQTPYNNIPRFKRASIAQPCLPGDSSCYCSKIGYCYNYIQYIQIDHCTIDKFLDDNLIIEVIAANYAGQKYFQTFQIGQSKDIQCRKTGLTSGTIAGIIIGVLLFLILIILLIIFLVWVFVLRKPLAPYDNLKQKFKRSEMVASANNELYIAGPDNTGPGYDSRQKGYTPPVAFDNRSNNIADFNSGEINSNNLIIGEELSSSNFVVSKAIWITPGKKVIVASKGMKRGLSNKMKDNLRNKIEICRKLPDNINLLKFFGAVEDFKGNGPIMVMEYCPMTLKEWLERAHPTPDVLDDMSLFCLNISKGVEFLHDNKIIHKRISLRNVMLAKYYDQYVAKIIGYGQKADADSSSSVPIRWLSPETLLTLRKDRPTYNEKTDAWSYGITIWEIYTFGAKKPYPDLSNDQAQAAIKNGTIMDCPAVMATLR